MSIPSVAPVKGNVKRLTQLDSLRGVAALAVFFEHFSKSFNFDSKTYNLAYYSPLHMFWDGHASVMLFFLLSGFVLSLPFVNNQERPLYLTEFYLKRVLRLYPAYLTAIGIALILKTFVYNPQNVTDFSLWLKNIWHWSWDKPNQVEVIKSLSLIGKFNVDLIIPAIWSLVIEMRISLLLPFLIIIVSKANFKFNILFFLVITYWGAATETTLGVFYMGILLAKYQSDVLQRFNLESKKTVIGVLLLAVLLYTIDFTLRKDSSSSAAVRGIVNYSIALGSGLFIVILIKNVKAANLFKKQIFIFFGDISYSFYLIHMPVLYTMCSVFKLQYTYSPVLILLTSLTISIGLSYLMVILIEKPFQRLASAIASKYPGVKSLNIKNTN